MMYITAGCMGCNTVAFFVGITTPQAGYLALLWEASIAFGLASTTLNFLMKQKMMEKMASTKATYTVEESTVHRGGNRLLRLMPPGLKEGLRARRFK